MVELAELLAEADLRQRALLVLVVTIAALVALAMAFAAYAVWVRLRTDARERRWRRLRATWEPQVLAHLTANGGGGVAPPSVAPEDRLFFVRFLLEYHRRMTGQEADALRALALPYLGPVARRAAGHRPEQRARAIQTLGALGLPEHAAEVIAALEDPSPLVAMVAARALCTRRHPEYGAAVLRRVERFRGWSRGFLASMLAGVGTEMAPHLRKVLGDDDEAPQARAVAAEALRRLADLASGDVAARVAGAAADVGLAAASLRLLAVVGKPEHLGVVRTLTASGDPTVRAAAMSVLGTLGSAGDHPRLVGGMGDPSPWVAIQAARSLVRTGGGDLLVDLRDSDHPRAALAAQVLLEAGGAP